MANDTPKVLFEFTVGDAANEWQTVNDGVMGGVSEGKFKISDAKTLEFFGNLSLEYGGCPTRRLDTGETGAVEPGVVIGLAQPPRSLTGREHTGFIAQAA